MRNIRDCNVCVLGGAGFLGSHLVNHLIEDRGCSVTVIDNLVSGRREFIHKKATFIHHDVTGSEEYLREIFKAKDIRYVANYIAMPYIPDSFERPLRVFDINAMGALKVMNAAQEADVEAILQVSSAEIYGEGCGNLDWEAKGKICENDQVAPHSTYGAAKSAIDSLVQVRWKEAETPVIALRQFNCIGERETHPYVVPEIIGQLSKIPRRAICHSCRGVPFNAKEYAAFGECPKCGGANRALVEVLDQGMVNLGNNSFRDFQYAGDAVRMAAELLEKGSFGEVYNMGSEDGVKIYDLAKLIGKLMGFKDVEIVQDPTRIRPWEIWHLQSDNSKLYSTIETRPQVSFEDALKRTIDYYRSNGSKWCWE